MTERESAHPQPVPLSELTLAEPAGLARPQEGGAEAAQEETAPPAQVPGGERLGLY